MQRAPFVVPGALHAYRVLDPFAGSLLSAIPYEPFPLHFISGCKAMIKASWLYSAFADCPLAFEMLMGLVRQRNAQAFGPNEIGPFYEWPLGGDDLILAQQIALMLAPVGSSVAELLNSSSVIVLSVANSDVAYSAKAMLVHAADAHFELEKSARDDDDAKEHKHPLPLISYLDRSAYRGQMKELLSKAYRTETFVICVVSPDSDEESLASMRLAADRDLELPGATAEHVGRVFLSLFKERPDEIDVLVGLENLGAEKLGAALRPARTIKECLTALRGVTLGHAEPATAPVKPRLEDAAGFGEARVWALDLATDYTLWKAGDLEWDEVPERGLLISGPPGTGKTTFARLLANTLERPLIETSIAAWSGFDNLSGTIVEMNRVFNQARSLQGVLFIDELDGINRRDQAGERNRAYWDQVVNHLLTRVNDILESPGVVVVGATNYPDKIDPALLRAGRIERHIRIVPPSVEDRAIILDQYLKGALEPGDVERIATLTDRFSGADLKRLTRGSMARARRGKRVLTVSDVLLELARDTETLSEKDRRRALIYAAGRELVSRSLGSRPEQGSEYLTLSDLQDQLAVMMAGRAAEELVLKSVSTLGEADLERATDIAEAVEVKFGMGTSGPIALHLIPQTWDLSAAVRQHIEQALGRARHVLEEKMGELEIKADEPNAAKRVVH